ncbi:FAD-dependent oxidoreductase [Microbacterium horticulturae]|uniref:FAD-dependent oxidoreductase n=1 Tax=Microbacterium horticulturae TaxID=3028316 RepID=A0ABY8BYH4_9MICO|nr:FAD-dependent oxidoreductase [Microbacterium sp. KACC 23027]WEG09239.1 FAD-dependent oxidoreductase [Microbacterium sp. KACC 23027]
MTKKSALISGSGIAGATAAYWLARSGWNVTVVEKADAVRSSGNPIDVRGDAAAVVREMGVWPRLRAAATRVDRLEVVDSGGGARVTIDTRQTADLEQEVEVPRADLAAALLAAARDEAEVIVGDVITGLEQDRHGIDATFNTGAPGRFDLVIGADGLHSGVRRIAFGPESDFASPFGMFVGTMHTRIASGDPRALQLFNRPGVSLSIHPGAGSPLAAFIFRSDRVYDRHDPEAHKRLVRDAYTGQGWVSDQAVAEWLATDDVYFDAVTRIAMPAWTAGRITLLGDAADCISLLGEGSSNAIVAAKTLADAIAKHPSDVPSALSAYERRHRARVRAFHRRARRNSHWLVPTTSPGIAFRNASMRVATMFQAVRK